MKTIDLRTTEEIEKTVILTIEMFSDEEIICYFCKSNCVAILFGKGDAPTFVDCNSCNSFFKVNFKKRN